MRSIVPTSRRSFEYNFNIKSTFFSIIQDMFLFYACSKTFEKKNKKTFFSPSENWEQIHQETQSWTVNLTTDQPAQQGREHLQYVWGNRGSCVHTNPPSWPRRLLLHSAPCLRRGGRRRYKNLRPWKRMPKTSPWIRSTGGALLRKARKAIQHVPSLQRKVGVCLWALITRQFVKKQKTHPSRRDKGWSKVQNNTILRLRKTKIWCFF